MAGREDYEERREARIERYEERAHRAHREADARHNSQANRMLSHMPLGQPILVGHHSEKRHRRLIERANNDTRKAIEANEKAKHYEHRAESARKSRAISSDDPEAITKLRAKIAKAEKFQEAVKAANKVVRRKPKNVLTEKKVAELVGMGFEEAKARQLFEPDFAGRIGIPSYALTNNSGNIRRMKERLAHLEKMQDAETEEQELAGGVRIVQNVELNRTQIFFPDIPSEEVRKELKSMGFRFSKYDGNAWQRHLSTGARFWGKRIVEKFYGISEQDKAEQAEEETKVEQATA